MQTNKWGSETWMSLHCITFNAPDIITQDKQNNYINYFTVLKELLPCKYCRFSYKVFLHFLPIQRYIDCKMGLTYWLYTIHNLVNIKLQKQTVSFIDVVVKYENMKATDSTKIDNIHKYVDDTHTKYKLMTVNLLKRLYSVLKEYNYNFEKICTKYSL